MGGTGNGDRLFCLTLGLKERSVQPWVGPKERYSRDQKNERRVVWSLLTPQWRDRKNDRCRRWPPCGWDRKNDPRGTERTILAGPKERTPTLTGVALFAPSGTERTNLGSSGRRCLKPRSGARICDKWTESIALRDQKNETDAPGRNFAKDFPL